MTLISCPVFVAAVGFRLPNQDPEGIARGNAFAATADNPSAVYYNPAGINQLEGHQFSVGLYYISTDVEYTSNTGAHAETDTDFQAVPQLHYVYAPTNSNLAFGLGVYVPYGLALDWGDDTSFRTLATEGELLYLTVNPVVSYQVHPTLSLGIGPTLNYSEVTFKRGISPAPSNDEFEVEGDDFAYGFNAGLLWQPHQQWSFGINYRYTTTMNYRGESEAKGLPGPLDAVFGGSRGTSAELTFPQFVVAGVSYRPTENWNIEVNVDWTDWDNLNDVEFVGTAFDGTVFDPPPFEFNYESSFMYEFGVTRRLPKGFFVSAGYIYSENSSPDQYFNPIVPDSDLHLGSIGFGQRGKRWQWAVAYHFAYNDKSDVDNSQPNPITLENADGKYETFNHAVNASFGMRF